MKRILFGLIFLVLSLGNAFSQIFDSYNILLILDPGRHRYNVNYMLESCFRQKGFEIYMYQNWNDIPREDWDRTMSVEWEVFPAYDAPSTVVVKFKDSKGRVLATCEDTGMTLSLSGDTKSAMKKIISNLRDVPYQYRPSKVDETKFPPILITEDSVRSYLLSKSKSDFEGIYKTYGENWYRFAIVKQKDKYAAFILDSQSSRWKWGDIKAYFELVKRNLYSTTYLMQDKSTREVLATFDGEILSIPLGSDAGTFQALKIFPTNESSSIGAVEGEGHWVSSGSGFFISDRIIATNYHVIKNANSIKIVVKNGTVVKSYTAKVLISDNTNDLALVSITDKEFKGVTAIPYRLFLDTKEVGTSIFTMGYPMSDVLGNEIKITDGIISSKTGYQGDIVTYQITAPIQPGNSGGALFDKNGVLVGITNAGVPSAENVGYAIKTVYLKNLIDAAPIYIELPTGKDLRGKNLPDLVKILSPYVVFVEVY